MTSGLARLVLNKQALCGLRVLFWHNQLGQEKEGVIQAYDQAQDSFVLYDDLSGNQYGVQFHEFTVEEQQQQLVLKVTRCTQVAIGNQYKVLGPCTESVLEDGTVLDDPGTDPTLDATNPSGANRLPSTQLSIELTRQWSGMIGTSFSQAAEGFATVPNGAAMEDLTVHSAAAVVSELGDLSDGDDEQPSYWGSPVKSETAGQLVAHLAGHAAACSTAMQGGLHSAKGAQTALGLTQYLDQQCCEGTGLQAASSVQPLQPAVGSEQGPTMEAIDSDSVSMTSSQCSPCPSSQGSPYRRRSSIAGHNDEPPAVPAHAAAVSASYNSFQEISRMISTTEPAPTGIGIPIPNLRRSSGKHLYVAGVAARLLEESGTWGTPKEGSPWGTPRDLQLAEAGTADVLSAATAAAAPSAAADLPSSDQGRPCQQHQQQVSAGHGEGAACPSEPDLVDNLTAAFDNGMALAAGSPSSCSHMLAEGGNGMDADYTITAGDDVQPRPTSRSAARSARELYMTRSPESTDAGMMVDIPQTLSSRRVSRTSVRAMQLGSDPGSAAGAAGFTAAAELRRTTSNMSSLPSRRVSRTISNRLNADQDWTPAAHDPALPHHQQQQQLPPYPGQGLASSGGGASMHVPGPASRRTSRTLSGRLPLDQNGTVFVAPIPDDAAPDVSPRPLAAPGLETIASRRQSSANARPGTPDSDGFGLSEFEGIEPLVPPELAQWDAIVEEAVANAGDATSTAHPSHRHQRRSLRNLGAVPAAPAVAQRPSMRVSDQDDQWSFSPSSTGVHSSSLHPTASGELMTPALEEPYSLVDQAPQSLAATSSTAPSQAAHQARTHTSGIKNSSEDVVDDPAARPGVGPCHVSRSSSRKANFGGLLQVAAAAAEAAAVAVGLALSGTKAAAGDGQDKPKAPQQPTSLAAAEPQQQQHLATDNACAQAVMPDYALPAIGEIKTRLAAHGVLAADALIPVTSSGTKSNPFADPGIFNLDAAQLSAGAAAFQIGTVVATSPPEQQEFGSFDAESALVHKQPLPAYGILAEGSEWGSGTFTPHITSGIDTPTGSGIFRTNPFAEGSECGSASPSHLSSALDGLPSVLGKASIGASRMAREAAAVAAATLPFGGMTTSYNWKSSSVSISEITPTSDDEHGDEHEGTVPGSEYAAGLQRKLRFAHSSSNSLQQASGNAQQPLLSDTPAGSTASAYDSSVSSMWRLPPSYAGSMGAEADDERSPSAVHSLPPTKQLWPANNIATANSGHVAGGSREIVRHDAELLEAAAHAAAGAVQSSNEQQVVGDIPAPLGGESVLTRRNSSRPSSRTASQLLSNNVTVCSDGLVVLPAPMYNYEDDDHQPLVQHQAGLVAKAPGNVTRHMVDAQSQIGLVVLHSFLAISTQWFDIIALVVLGGQLMAAMGSPLLSTHQQLSTLLWIFAAGHLLWPVGCMLWPSVSVRAGRKAVLAWTVGLSAFPTALLGCMPAYSEGAGSGLVVIGVLWILSGIAADNSSAAAVAYLAEHAPQAPQLHTSLVPGAMAAGALGATVFALVMSWVLSAASLGVFGWRLVLVASLVAHSVSGVLRGFVLQDPQQLMSTAESSDRRNTALWSVIRHYPAQICVGLLMQTFAVSGFVLMTAWMPVFFTQYGQLPEHIALSVQSVNVAVLAGCIPLGGLLADRHGRMYVLLATCAAAVVFAYPAWLLFSLAVPAVSWFSQFTLVVFVGLHYGALTGTLVDLFPKGMRSSALNMVFVLPMVLLGGTTPLAALELMTQTGSQCSPAILMMITAVVSAAAITYQAWGQSLLR